MTARPADLPTGLPEPAPTAGRSGLRLLFSAVILTGSFLLFLVQPMFGRMILPRLGGAPAVWNTALAFYQAALLAGYLYAHALTRCAPAVQAGVHLLVLAGAAFSLPFAVTAADSPPPGGSPALWQFGLMATTTGPVFVAVAAQSPLMQAWFARTDDPAAANPYFLYATSNAGSLSALLAYPLLVEPNLPLRGQAQLWAAGYLLLVALVLAAAVAVARRPAPAVAAPIAAPPVPWRRKLHWLSLAAVPAGLLVSTTTHLTTDIMAMPLLWVAPLALYLVSFILAFARKGAPRYERPALLLLLVLGSSVFLASGLLAFLMAAAGLVLFFFLALALHAELARLRPDPRRLTEFYLLTSLGGVLGGLFAALLAPLLFDWSYEHPILLLAAALLLPAAPVTRRIGRLWRGRAGRLLAFGLPLAGAGVALALALDPSLSLAPGPGFQGTEPSAPGLAGAAALATAAILAIGRRGHFAFLLAMTMLALGGWQTIRTSVTPGARSRSFFGIYAIETSRRHMVRKLMHGTTLHGVQSLLPAYAMRPMSYYAPASGIGRAMAAVPSMYGRVARVGFVGLGAGTLACYARPGQFWTAYEIDPLIVRIARDERLFSYIHLCAPRLKVELGDARLSLERARPNSLDLLALDAFSSDAIPMHLMTTEAFHAYARVLGREGLLLVHISNRFIDLRPVLAAIAERQGWGVRILDFAPPADRPLPIYDTRSIWVAMSRDPSQLDRLERAAGGNWQPLGPRPGFAPWTDDFATLLPVLK